jgi:cytochrome c oxidase subunit 2
LAPHSPGTDQISTLLWIGLVAGAVVVVLVNAALIYALRRYRAARGVEPRQATAGRRTQLRVGAALGIFAAAILVLGIVFTERARQVPRTGPTGLPAARTSPTGLPAARTKPLRIEATGQQWLWRYSYPNGTFSYYRLVVPVETAVELDLVSTDVVHTWDVPELAGMREAVPGKINHVVFRADQEGRYFGQAATLSGQAYAAMRTEVEVVSPPAYEAFVERQKSEVEAAQKRVVSLIESGKAP